MRLLKQIESLDAEIEIVLDSFRSNPAAEKMQELLDSVFPARWSNLLYFDFS
jgi:hypothetical protein